MKIDDYAQQAITTLSSDYAYGDANAQLMGMVLGLGGESGEVLEKFKKLLRDQQGTITEEDKQAIIKELGDIFWYVTAVAHLLGSSLEEVAQRNNAKLASRQQRGQLRGSGDDR